MPLRVTCQCGQTLNVPDNLAGKLVKCPKCQKGVQVPGPAPAASTAASTAAKAVAPVKAPSGKGAAPTGKGAAPKGAAAKPAAKSPATNSAMADLFDQAGLTQREGTFCPACDKQLPVGTAICVGCGFHLEQGAKIEGFQVESKEFGNQRLVEAAQMMKREAETDKRLLTAGMPWWMMLAILAGLLVMIVSVLIKMDATTSGTEASNPMLRRIQNATFFAVLAMSFGLAMTLIANFAQFAILITAFKESVKQGLLCLFIPFYIIYYMFSRIQTMKLTNTVIILWVTAILAAIALAYSLPKI